MEMDGKSIVCKKVFLDRREHAHGAMYRRAYRPNEPLRGSPKTYSPTPEGYKKSIDPRHVDKYGMTPLHWAIQQDGDDDVYLQRVIKAGCDVNVADNDGHRGIHLASERGFTRCIQKLVQHGAEVNVLDKCGYSPLMLAARHGFPKAVRALIRAGANPNLDNDKNEQALHYGVCKGHLECVQDLLSNKADPNHANAEGTTPLMFAVRFRHMDVVQLLIGAGANLDKKDDLGRSALHWAAYTCTEVMAQVLVEAGAEIDSFDKHGESPFVYSIQTNNHMVLRYLLSAGCDRDTIDGLNGTALGLAALKGHNECVRVLLETGDEADGLGFFGMTPLMFAAFESHVDVAQTLLDHGADPNAKARLSVSPLIKTMCHVCKQNETSRHKIAAMFIRAGADVNAQVNKASYFTSITNGKNCALSFALCSGYVSLIHMLLVAGSRVSCVELREWFKSQNVNRFYDIKNLLKPIKDWKEQPKSLRHLSRMTIRNSLRTKGFAMTKDINSLPIATLLKEYVGFSDLDDIEPHKADVAALGGRDLLGMQPRRPCPGIVRVLEGTYLHQAMTKGQI